MPTDFAMPLVTWPAREGHTADADWSDYALDQAWATQVATQTPLAAMTPKVNDVKYTLVDMLDYRDVWLSERVLRLFAVKVARP